MTLQTNNSNPDIRIHFNNLYVSDSDLDGGTIHLPLKQLPSMEDAAYQHIHGFLEIQVKGHKLPYLGFFTENDVCFNTWIAVLYEVEQAFKLSSRVIYSFDEGEQGQTAFQFQREDDWVYISIVESKYSGSSAVPEWQRIACNYTDFHAAIEVFLTDIKTTLQAELNEYASEWLEATLAGQEGQYTVLQD